MIAAALNPTPEERSSSLNGAYTRITDSLIAAEGDAVSGASFTDVDDGLMPGVTRYYKLESVTTSGSSTLHGPVWATVQGGNWLYLPLLGR